MIKQYKCEWCRTEFKQDVNKSEGGNKTCSDQVRCPKCFIFIKTWEKSK